VLGYGLYIEPGIRNDRSIAFDDARNLDAVELGQKLGRVVSNVAEALDDGPLPLKPAF
jgi:hypothetical protein